MDKGSKKNLIGQPIFKKKLKLIPRNVTDKIVLKMKSDSYCKSFSTWDELVTLLFGVFERCDSAREVCDGMATNVIVFLDFVVSISFFKKALYNSISSKSYFSNSFPLIIIETW